MNPATLRTLLERAKARSDAAQLRYAGLLRSADRARAHLGVLRQYAQEYDDRARCRSGDSRDPSADRNQTAFLVRLQQAVEAQVREIEVRQSATDAAASDLALCLQQRKSLETLALRRIEQERRVQAQRDQKSTDEFAQRAHDRAASTGLHRGENNAGSER